MNQEEIGKIASLVREPISKRKKQATEVAIILEEASYDDPTNMIKDFIQLAQELKKQPPRSGRLPRLLPLDLQANLIKQFSSIATKLFALYGHERLNIDDISKALLTTFSCMEQILPPQRQQTDSDAQLTPQDLDFLCQTIGNPSPSNDSQYYQHFAGLMGTLSNQIKSGQLSLSEFEKLQASFAADPQTGFANLQQLSAGDKELLLSSLIHFQHVITEKGIEGQLPEEQLTALAQMFQPSADYLTQTAEKSGNMRRIPPPKSFATMRPNLIEGHPLQSVVETLSQSVHNIHNRTVYEAVDALDRFGSQLNQARLNGTMELIQEPLSYLLQAYRDRPQNTGIGRKRKEPLQFHPQVRLVRQLSKLSNQIAYLTDDPNVVLNNPELLDQAYQYVHEKMGEFLPVHQKPNGQPTTSGGMKIVEQMLSLPNPQSVEKFNQVIVNIGEEVKTGQASDQNLESLANLLAAPNPKEIAETTDRFALDEQVDMIASLVYLQNAVIEESMGKNHPRTKKELLGEIAHQNLQLFMHMSDHARNRANRLPNHEKTRLRETRREEVYQDRDRD